MSKNPTRSGTVYRSRSAEGHLTCRRFSALGSLVLGGLLTAAIGALVWPGVAEFLEAAGWWLR